MSRFYNIRSADGHRSYGCVTKQTARGMVRRGEATFVPDRSVVQLVPPASGDVGEDAVEKASYPWRGLSASPDHRLTLRYAIACDSDSDAKAVDAVEAWAR